MENQISSYYAFISYSRKDIKEAKWIHSSLERFHIPTKLPRAPEAEPIPNPLKCFRDINDLDVMPESFVKGIENALSASKYLIVICSPNSARSTADGNHYVDWEIQKFIEVHGLEYSKAHILPVIINGEITNNSKDTECLPPTLYKLGDDFLQHNFPILDYGDENNLTKELKNDFIMKILAFLLQVKYSILNDRYQKAQQKKRHLILGTAISLVFIFAIISTYAGIGWKKANKNLAYSDYTQANSLLKQGEISQALAYYKKSLQLYNDSLVRDKVYNLITKGSWLVDKDEITKIPEKEIDYLTEKEICKKLQIVKYSELEQTKNWQNGLFQKISDDGKYVVVYQKDKSIKILNVETGNIIYEDFAEPGFTWSDKNGYEISIDCEFSDNCKLLIYSQKSINNQNDLYSYEPCFIFSILNLTDMSVKTFTEKRSIVNWTISPDGNYLVYSTRLSNTKAELSVFDIVNNQKLWTRSEDIPRALIAFSPDNIHFATTGSIFLSDPVSQKISINNIYHEEEQLIMDVNGAVEKMVFSNDGRKIAASTNRNSLYVFTVRDGKELIYNRLFSNRIHNITFTPDDNNIQLLFENIGRKEYSIRVNKINFDILKSPLESSVITDSVLLGKDYIVNLVGNLKRGRFIEIQNLYDKNDYYITPINKDISAYDSGLWKIKKSLSEKFLFLYDTAYKEKVIDVYSIDLNNEKYLNYMDRIILPYFIEEIISITENQLLVICEKNKPENVFLVDLYKNENKIQSIPYSNILNAGTKDNILYLLCSDIDNGKDYFTLKKIDIKNMTEIRTITLENFKSNHSNNTILIDKNDNIYIPSDEDKILIFDKKGNQKNIIKTSKRITSFELSNDSSLLAIGINSAVIGHDVNEVEVWRLKDNTQIFKTEYNASNPVRIRKIMFSDNCKLIHISGKLFNGNGFYDIWDINNFPVSQTEFSKEIPEIFGFDVINNLNLLYTSEGLLTCSFSNNSKETYKELREDSIYDIIGGWTLNKNNVPQLIEHKENKTPGKIQKWLETNSFDSRTIQPDSERLVKDLFYFWIEKVNDDYILDIQSNNSQALKNYWYRKIKKICEKNFKNKISVNVYSDELKIDNQWLLTSQNNFWEIALKDDEVLNSYKFLLNSYSNKYPDSIEPLQDLIRYYYRIQENEKAKNYYDQMKEQFKDLLYIKLLLLYESNEPYEQKQISFEKIKNKNNNYSFEDLNDIFEYYQEQYPAFEDAKKTISWMLEQYKSILNENWREYADDCSSLFEKIYDMVCFYEGGFDYLLHCADYISEGFSESQKILLNLDDLNLYCNMMNCIIKNDDSYIQKITEQLDLSQLNFNMILKTESLIPNLFMNYSYTNNPQKNTILNYLLYLDKINSFEGYSSFILKDFRIYKRLGITNVYSDEDKEKVFNFALKLMLYRIKSRQTAGLMIFDVIEGSQAQKLGLKKGDYILFYDKYPLSTQDKEFLLRDLHTSDKLNRRNEVELIIRRNDKIFIVKAKEGLLGVNL